MDCKQYTIALVEACCSLESITEISGIDMTLSTTPQLDSYEDFFSELADRLDAVLGSADLSQLTDDPVALSVSVWRSWTKQGPDSTERWMDLKYAKATDQDREMASAIRQYYRNKLMLKALTNTTDKTALTEFLQALYQYLNSNDTVTTEQLGMIYRLPYFYAEDQAREQLTLRYADHQPQLTTHLRTEVNITKTLQPVTKILRSRRGAEMQEFWFETQQQQLVLLPVSVSNPLLTLADSLYQQDSVTVTGYFRPTRLRGFDLTFYNLFHFGLTVPRHNKAAQCNNTWEYS
jgi:hypothetical protein